MLLEVGKDIADKLIEQYPFYTKVVIPAKLIQTDRRCKCCSHVILLVVTEDMDEELAYEITKAIYSNLDRLETAHTVVLITKEAPGRYVSRVASWCRKIFPGVKGLRN